MTRWRNEKNVTSAIVHYDKALAGPLRALILERGYVNVSQLVNTFLAEYLLANRADLDEVVRASTGEAVRVAELIHDAALDPGELAPYVDKLLQAKDE